MVESELMTRANARSVSRSIARDIRTMSTNSEVDAEAGTKKRNIILLSAFAVIAVIVIIVIAVVSGDDDTAQSSAQGGTGGNSIIDVGDGDGQSGEATASASPAPTYSYRTPDTSGDEVADLGAWQSAFTKASVYGDDDWVTKGADSVGSVDDADLAAMMKSASECVTTWTNQSSWMDREQLRKSLEGCALPDFAKTLAGTWSLDTTPSTTSSTSDGRVWQDSSIASTDVYSYVADLDGKATALVEVMVDRAQYAVDTQNPDAATRRSGTTQAIVKMVDDGGWKVAAMWIPTN